MPTNFPTSLDTLSNPTGTTETTDPTLLHSSQHATVNDAIEAIEAKLGIGASTPGATAALLRRTAASASAWGAIQAGDVAPGALTRADVAAADLMALSAQNPIINGGMEIHQRGTDNLALASSGSSAYVADCWQVVNNTPANILVVPTGNTPLPAATSTTGNFSSGALAQVPSAITDSHYAYIGQKMEGYLWLPFAQKQFTIGFWIHPTIAGTFSLCVKNGTNTRSCVREYVVAPGEVTTWVYKTVTFPASTLVTVGNGWNTTNGLGVQLIWTLAGGATYATSSLNTWNNDGKFCSTNQVNAVGTSSGGMYLWGVTMGLGPTVAPYWPRPYAQELALCLRYCYIPTSAVFGEPRIAKHVPGSLVIYNGTTTAQLMYPYPVPMRTSYVTVTQSGMRLFDSANASYTPTGDTTIDGNHVTANGFWTQCTVAGATQHRVGYYGGSGSVNDFLIVSAEL